MPTRSQARRLLRTYTWLAGSSPTRTVARPGFGPPAATNSATPAAVSACIVSARALPSRIRAGIDGSSGRLRSRPATALDQPRQNLARLAEQAHVCQVTRGGAGDVDFDDPAASRAGPLD